jgi:HlyD family secretion protein
LAAVIAVVVLVGAGTATWLLTRATGPVFVTSVVHRGNVAQTLDSTGTVQPVDEANLHFQVAGQVASVAVTVGQQVTVGEQLAQLDTSTLSSTVSNDQSTLSTDEAKLTADQASEVSSSTTTTTTTTAPGSSGGTSGGFGGGSGSGQGATLSQAQSTVEKAQQQANNDESTAQSDLQNAQTVCETTTGQSGTTTTTTTTPTTTTTCTAALQQVVTDQQAVSKDLSSLSADESALNTLVAQSTSGSVTPSTTGSASTTGQRTGFSSTTSTPATADQIAADQATIDADDATLSEAQQALDQATLVSPIAGTVSSVTITPGQSVTAGSATSASTAEIVVQGPQSYEVATTVSTTNVNEVKVGESATVSPDGASSMTGTVTNVGLLSSSASTYPVTVSLNSGNQQLFNGSEADVSIVVSQANNTLTVPTSAVHLLGSFAFVTELANGKVSSVRVDLGAVGPALTQVTSGIHAGATVVLANPAEPLPSTASSTTGRAVTALTGGGGFGGGEFRGGGATARTGG